MKNKSRTLKELDKLYNGKMFIEMAELLGYSEDEICEYLAENEEEE